MSGHVAPTLFDRSGTGLSPGPVVDGGREASVGEVLTVVEDVGPPVSLLAMVLHYRGDRLIGFRGTQDLAAGLPRATLVALDGRVHLPDASDLDRLEELIVRHVSRG